jgi:hypothetical protein
MKRRFLLVVAAALALAIVAPAAFADGGGGGGGGGGKVIYDSTVSPFPGNLPSVGAEAYAFSEFGDQVTFAGTARKLREVTVQLSSWGCQAGHWYSGDCVTAPGATFTVPITFTVYNPGPGGTAGAPIVTRTQTFTVPYRPSADPVNCTGGRWFHPTLGCFNGLLASITFDFKSLNVTLPGSVVYGISYNTSHYGPAPIGESPPCYTSSSGCPYDSLNIALAPTVVVGSKPSPDTVFQNTSYASNYCDGGAAGVGTFRLDSPTSACWAGYVPAVQFTATGKGGQGGDNQGGHGDGGNDNGGHGGNDNAGHGNGGGHSHNDD